ncbi:hypothetical protein [Dietzia cinnamea]|uniref:hypothetical protein n=1 Tax=Dietzia cinnamea TaxID=321318 RepID=UPI00223B1A20|nr:hypothetical protein [Dietzia cinnamea]MCT2076061.1 hypothetical protein [Dietzia cinnamea]MCT2219798.1 hypothetical protein [Dietzia cinnamea]
MSRILRRSPDESLSEWIQSRREVLHQRKVNPQPIGDAGVIIRSYDVGEIWNGSLVAGGQGGGGVRVIRVTVTADNMQVLYATAFAHLYVDGVRYRPSNYLEALKAGSANTYSLSAYSELPADEMPNKRVWLITVSGPVGGACSLRMYVNSPDTFTVNTEVVV